MKTFKQYLEEKEASGWINPKGSFIKNRKGDTHADTYSKITGYGKKRGDVGRGYYVDHAIKQGWSRVHIEKDGNEAYGIVQRKKSKWTPRHDRALRLIKKAIGIKKKHYNGIEIEDK